MGVSNMNLFQDYQKTIKNLNIKVMVFWFCIVILMLLGISGIVFNQLQHRQIELKPLTPLEMTQLKSALNERLVVYGEGLLELRGAILSISSNAVTQEERNEVVADEEAMGKPVSANEAFRKRGIYKFGLLGSQLAGSSPNQSMAIGQRLQSYISSQDSSIRFPGLAGFGYIKRVPNEGLGQFIGEQRRNGRLNFSLRQIETNQDDHYVIEYAEPKAINLQLIGLDVASDSAMKAAAIQAAKTDQAIMTSPINLVNESGQSDTQFLLFLPVYSPEMPLGTESQRSQAVKGWVFARLLASDIFQGINLKDKNLEYALIDEPMDGDKKIFWKSSHFISQTPSALNKEESLLVYGRRWMLEAQTTPFIRDVETPSIWILILSILSMMLAILMAGFVFIFPKISKKYNL
jgi:CHASE1-domain containing sensor protein